MLMVVGDSTPRKDLHGIAVAHLDREIQSGEALGTRAGALIGFCGVILALAATLGRDVLSRDLGAVGRPLATVAFVAAVVVIFVAAVQALRMLTPRQRGRTKPQVLRELRRIDDSEAIHGRLSKSAITIYAEEAAKNDSRGRRLRCAYFTLTAGLALVAVQAAIVALNETENPCKTPRTIETTTATTLAHRTTPLPTTTTRVETTSSTGCAKTTKGSKPRRSGSGE